MALSGAMGFDLAAQVSPNAVTIPQYSVVTHDTAGGSGPFDMILAVAATTFPVGVVQSVGGPPTPGGTIAAANTPGQSIDVRVSGITKCVAGAAIAAAGTLVSAAAGGQVVAAAAPGATNSYVIGIALSTAAAAGDLVAVLLTPGATTQVNA